MHVRKKLRQKFGYPRSQQMSAANKKNRDNGTKKQKAMKKWNIPTIHTLPTGAKRGIPLDPAESGTFRKCDVAFGNSCFSTGTVGFLMASVVVNSIAGEKRGSKIPIPLGTVGRNRGPVPLRGQTALPVGTSRGLGEGQEEAVKVVNEGVVESNACECGAGGSSDLEGESATQRESVTAEAIGSVTSDTGGLLSTTVVVDAHCHLQLDPLYSRSEEAILRARENKIAFAVVCGTCPGDDWDRVRELYVQSPDFIAPQFGLHPWWISRHFDTATSGSSSSIGRETETASEGSAALWEEALEQLLVSIPASGVGECGLDNGLKNVGMGSQVDILRQHIVIAARHNRPVTMHCVGAWAKLLEVLRDVEKSYGSAKSDSSESEGKGSDRGRVRAYVLHSCNSLPKQMVADYLKIPNVYFSFSGRTLTAKKEGNLASRIPMDRILVETDSPDQLPLTLKGKMRSNEPSLVRLNIGILASLMAVDPNVLAAATVENARRVFQP
jgi:TatD DNase family protein